MRGNHFVKKLFDQQSLTAAPPPSLWERLKLARDNFFSTETILGAGEAAMYMDDASEVDFTKCRRGP